MNRILIQGGRVIDPASGVDNVCDVLIENGRIAAIGRDLEQPDQTIDATGLIVAPGFIDLHAHGQSIPADRMQAFDGVTTTLDLESGVTSVYGVGSTVSPRRLQRRELRSSPRRRLRLRAAHERWTSLHVSRRVASGAVQRTFFTCSMASARHRKQYASS
jgi:Predicted amidohydrolase